MNHQIYELEIALLDPDIRKSTDKLALLIADDFIEFGSSGKIYTKQDIIYSLPNEPSIDYTLQDFKEQKLSENIILATYQITIKSIRSLRSSIWRSKNAKWEMIFHQGTICKD